VIGDELDSLPLECTAKLPEELIRRGKSTAGKSWPAWAEGHSSCDWLSPRGKGNDVQHERY